MINKNDFPLLGQKYTDLLIQQKLRNFADMTLSMRNDVIKKFLELLRISEKMTLEIMSIQIKMGLSPEEEKIFYLANAIQSTLNKKYELSDRLNHIAENEKRKLDQKLIGKKRQKVLDHIIEIDSLRSQGFSFPAIAKTLFRGKGKISVDYMKEIYYQNKKSMNCSEPQLKEQTVTPIMPPETFIKPAPKNFKPEPDPEYSTIDFLSELSKK